jgi:asparagine synthase (glutamine-hydrolysing)
VIKSKLIGKRPMGAIAGAVSKDGKDVCNEVLNMLKSMTHRGGKSSLLVCNSGSYSDPSLKSIRCFECSSAAIGANFREEDCIIHSEANITGVNATVIALTGKIHPDSSKERERGPLFDKPILEYREPKTELQSIIFKISKQLRDSYSVIGKLQDEVIAFRDPIGIKPLFFSESDSIFAFASEYKALIDIGMNWTQVVPIGKMIALHKNDFQIVPFNRLIKPLTLYIGIKSFSNMLSSALESTINRLTFNRDCCAVAFSGGIDSTLLARISESISVEPKAYVSGMGDCHDISSAKHVASKLDYALTALTLSISEVERLVDEVLKIIMDPSPMMIGIGIPLFSTAVAAHKDGFDSILLGQGADELFGGYSRYCKILREEKEEFLAETLWKDLINAHKTNLLRDDSVCMASSVTPLYPYLSLDVVNIAARIPIEFKVASPDDDLRKRVLRMVGKKYDLPDEIVNKKKKAFQFGSGVTKALRQIARKNGFSNSRDYLVEKYERIVEEN